MKPRSEGAAGIVALLVGSHVIALAGIWITARFLLGSVDEVVRWYSDGGLAMHVLLAISLAQLACGVVAAWQQLRRGLTMGLHLGATAAALFVGFAASMVAVRAARAGIATAPPDLKLLLWANALALADIPRQLGLLVAAWGMLAQVVSSSLNLWLRARRDAPYTPTVLVSLNGAAAITGGVVWVFATTPQVKLPTVLPLLVALVAGVLFCVFFAAAGARGARSPLAAYDPYWQAAAFSAAWLAAVGMVCWAMAFGDAAFGIHHSATLQRVVALPPELSAGVFRVAQAPAVLYGISRATTGITYSALALGTGLVWFARTKLFAWVEVRLGELTALAVIAAVLWGTDLYRDATLRKHHASLTAQLFSSVPGDLDLPTTGSSLRASKLPMAVYRDGALSLDGHFLGGVESPDLKQRLIARLRGEPANTSMAAPPSPNRRVVGLAMDRNTRLAVASKVVHLLHAAGVEGLKLMARERRHHPWPDAENLRRHDELAVLGDLLNLIGKPKHRAVDIQVQKATNGEANLPGAGPYLRFVGAEIVVVTDATSITEAGDDAVSRLTAQLRAIKNRVPEQRQIRIDPSAGQRWQDLIEFLDVARVTVDADGERQPLFDRPLWLLRNNTQN